MKLYYTKILLFCLPLNILAHSKNKLYMKPHTRTTTSRVLSECDIEKSIYDNNPDMKYVKENFDRQTSQRFEEYKERMIKNRQKCKEQCEKDIKQIILKDKIDKPVEEKIEKVCLRCGCGLGGVAASVGVLGTAVVNVWKTAAMDAAIGDAITKGLTEGAAMGATEGVAEVIAGLKALNIDKLFPETLGSFISATNYDKASYIFNIVNMKYKGTCKILVPGGLSNPSNSICDSIQTWSLVQGSNHVNVTTDVAIGKEVVKVVTGAKTIAEKTAKMATENVTKGAIKTNVAEVNATYASCQTAIIASVVAILVIVLVMVIIYLILRYRRKKKMNKKLQYTKLLN
ncbi:rifin [Plasmodium falciparum NF54]|uniref:Rifin n=2 Tax=Plasmodium falciparum TaxID=5833 RepID=C6KTF0_PLAF7|nr:rifin [Plasmodium falciparum 3D7]KAF4327734.1 rifin [Plasmodium falciparum NF54]PKC42820.1 rifin [Plasmodium falciparum NF54]CAG25130.2 rifin [Plasmodium falciparum 3D7]|eukprot:XP_024328932.1 rifin [Plasmodium falciparum 3D7]